MKKKEMTKDEISVIFNQRRVEFGPRKEFKTKEIQDILEEIPYSKNNCFVSLLAKNGCLKKVKKGAYKFTTEPVFKDDIYNCICFLKESLNKATILYRKKKKTIVNKEKEGDSIANAIKLLKSHGYKIIRLETIVKEIEV